MSRASSFSAGQEAEERLLSRAVGRLPSSSSLLKPRFYTLHRKRKRKPPTRALVKEGAILDDLYYGPTQCVLKGAAVWDFNTFVLDSVCGGRPVTVLCVFLLHQYDLLNKFALDAVTVWKCFSLIEDGYHSSNPYHNAIHAADVTQAMHCYLQEPEIDRHLTPFEKLAAIMASVCHDLDHPGVNQPFLIATDNHLAALYNNASVLENHHWRCAMGCLWESGLLDKWSPTQVAELQDMIRSLILATDITRQNEFLTKFKSYQDTATLDLSSAECRHFCLQIALKCADICNPCRPWETSRQWSQKICDEFYRQGDYERQLGLPVTAMCDRYNNSVANIQSGFIKFVVAPLFESWHRWLCTGLSLAMLTNLRTNLRRWEAAKGEEAREGLLSSPDSATGGPCRRRSGSSSAGSSAGTAGEKAACVADSKVQSSSSSSSAAGRRHSLPVSIPSSGLPRTLFRRESLTAEGPVLVFETLKMGDAVVDSVVTVGVGGEEEPLFPPSSIASMGDMARPRRGLGSAHSKAQRRQSLPPLWDAASLPFRLPLHPLPSTPLQEELPGDEEREPLLGAGAASSSSGGASDGNGASVGPGTTSTQHNAGSAGEERAPARVRRASLGAQVGAEEGDKENVAPPPTRDRAPHNILKTRLWRSLNYDEDSDLHHLGRGPKGLLKHLPQSQVMRRRGSAPLLKPEELRGGLRGGAEKPSLLELSKRRGSAPSNQMMGQLGSDALGLVSEERRIPWQPLLLPRERNPLNPLVLGGGSARLVQRRGSVPWDGFKGEHPGFFSSQGPRATERTPLLGQQPPHPEVGSGCGGGGGGYPMGFHSSEMPGGGLATHFDSRRGSTGLELLSGLWRLRLEQNGGSLCSDESVGISSSGGATPGTPGLPGGLPPLFQGPIIPGPPILRRGSLPTEFFVGGEYGRWAIEPS